jgi:hypothetical protein
MFQIDVPVIFISRPFVDLFRAFIGKSVSWCEFIIFSQVTKQFAVDSSFAHFARYKPSSTSLMLMPMLMLMLMLMLMPMLMPMQILVVGLYRQPRASEESFALPYVNSCPRRGTLLRPGDRLFVFCNPMNLEYARQAYFSHQLEMTLAAVYLSTKGLNTLRPAAHLPRKQKNRASQYADAGEGANADGPEGQGRDREAGGGPGNRAEFADTKGSNDDLKAAAQMSNKPEGGRIATATLKASSSTANATGAGVGDGDGGAGVGVSTANASPPRAPVKAAAASDKLPTPPHTPPIIPKLNIPVATKWVIE